MNEDMQLAVKKGAYYMDNHMPNWASAINFDRFEMNNCHLCIVGQAIGDYGIVISRACGQKPFSKEANEWAVEHGFDAPTAAFEESEDAVDCYRELETLWTEQVKERLG